MEFVHVELKRDTWLKPRIRITTPKDAIVSILNMIQNLDREEMIIITLATDGTVINSAILSVGTVNQSIFSMAELLRIAILSGCASVILMHNHPSGNTKPSSDDLEVTRKVAIACKLMNLELLDHIIVGEEKEYCSLKEDYEECFLVKKSDFEKLLIE